MNRPHQIKNLQDLNAQELIEQMLIHAKYAYLKNFEYRYLITDNQALLDWLYSNKHFALLFDNFYQRFVDSSMPQPDIKNLASEILNNYTTEFKPDEYEASIHMKLNEFISPASQNRKSP